MSYCSRVVVQAPGKVNLSLDITGTDARGYHLMEMVMLSIDLSDVLLVGRRSDDAIRVTCSSSAVPEDETNIAYDAAVRFFAATGIQPQGLSIHIDKRVPVQAGMAGGSANAAAVLCGLNRLFETGLDQDRLCAIGLECGADVPFCIMGGCCHARGVGEILTPLAPMPDCFFAIAKPPRGMSTRAAFKRYDDMAAGVARPNTAAMLNAIAAGDLAAIGGNMFNVLEQVNPVEEVEMLRGIMLCDSALGAVMTGSGTAVVGLFAEEKQAKRCVRHLAEQVEEAYLAVPVEHGARILHVS